MKFIDKIKKDKKFRMKVIIVAILALFIYSNFLVPGKKEVQSQEVCNEYNTPHSPSGHIIRVSDVTECKSVGCRTEYSDNPEDLGFLGNEAIIDFLLRGLDVQSDWVKCKSEVANGKYVLASSKSNAMSMCASGISSDALTDGWGDDVYICRAANPGTSCSGTLEKAIGGMVRATGLFEDDCKSAYYVGLFGGGFLLLIGIM